ncbi:MAG: response regulator [Thermodesulfobacteriota bacterium]
MTGEHKTILFADGSILFRRRISDILIEAGHRVIMTRDGEEAMSRIRRNPDGIDLLLLDVVTSRIDGFSVLRWMKERGSDWRFPVLVITGAYQSGYVVKRLKAFGVCGVLTKRFTPEEVIHHIHPLLYPRKREKRLLQRAPAAVPVTFTIGDSSCTGTVMNIGESGLFLQSKLSLLAGSVLGITFTLSDSGMMFHVKGVVRWATTLGTPDDLLEGAGIAFTVISAQERGALQQFVEKSNSQSPYMP